VPATPPFAWLEDAAAWFGAWLEEAALPLWAEAGVDPETGGFREALTWRGEPHDPRRRTRVQARQAFVFATAAADGLPGPWLAVADAGFAWLRRHGLRRDGLYVSAMDAAGVATDGEARLYEHAFVLLALSALHHAGSPGAAGEAEAIVSRLEGFRHPPGGFREAGDEPFQANAHMHLLEAAIAWMETGGLPGATRLADEIAAMATARFVSPRTGVLNEFFDAAWSPRTGEAGLIEPGHHFEWAWLLNRYAQLRRRPAVGTVARSLFAVGRRGFDPARGVVQNALKEDLSVRDAGARLWPQTEHLKAALSLDEPGAALEAANGLAAYLDTPARGVWRERMRADGGFVEEPSPATSLYHLFLAVRQLTRAFGRKPG
jgi:mannose-6-phosphate isomerase